MLFSERDGFDSGGSALDHGCTPLNIHRITIPLNQQHLSPQKELKSKKSFPIILSHQALRKLHLPNPFCDRV
jgi:hypothetical protein